MLSVNLEFIRNTDKRLVKGAKKELLKERHMDSFSHSAGPGGNEEETTPPFRVTIKDGNLHLTAHPDYSDNETFLRALRSINRYLVLGAEFVSIDGYSQSMPAEISDNTLARLQLTVKLRHTYEKNLEDEPPPPSGPE